MIVIVDYGMGNLRSVSKALEHLKAQVKVSSEVSDIRKAQKLVLPGVGAFGDAMKELKQRKLDQVIIDQIKAGKSFFGICLGLQLLFESSEESPESQGLGIFSGNVRRFRSKSVKIPHMGWNQMTVVKKHPFLNGVKNQSYFYFVHSYYAVPKDSQIIAGSCEYGGETVAAVIAKENIFATQFHPEKSQQAGLRILENFVRL